MEDAVGNSSNIGLSNVNEPGSSNESVSMEEVQPEWTMTRMNTAGDTSDSEGLYEMTPIRSEISAIPRD